MMQKNCDIKSLDTILEFSPVNGVKYELERKIVEKR
jgi:hypothetical protein